MQLISICGARPNFIKIAPVANELAKHPDSGIEHIIVHTGQHYDKTMSDTFFKEFNIPEPDINLEAGSGTHAFQTARIMEAFETYMTENGYRDRDDVYVMVVGDVNSTLACSITAKKLNVNVIHYEGGLRSFDREMPEEINRMATDAVADLFFVTEQSGVTNLKNEGHRDQDIHLVGNLMIDTLLANKEKAEQKITFESMKLEDSGYALMTMHRPSNVDDPDILKNLMAAFQKIGEWFPILFPMHPRTKKNLKEFGLWDDFSGIKGMKVTDPVGYHDLLNLHLHCRFVLTDSGGIQEESSVLGKPCLTMRFNTERPSTVETGTSVLVGNDPGQILKYADEIKNGTFKQGSDIPLWDGKTAGRMVKVLEELSNFNNREV